MKKRTLFDLYVVGAEFTIDDGTNSETVWIQKINQNEHEKAYRNANIKRAEYMIGKKDLDSAEALAVRGEYALIFDSQDAMATYLANTESSKKREVLEAELADADEWKNEGYLQGLYDGWENEHKDRLALDPEDEESKRVYEELIRFYAQVEEKMDKVKEREKKDTLKLKPEELEKKVLEKLIATEADTAWINEYKLSEIAYAVRDIKNHREYYFTNREDINQLPFNVLVELLREYERISVGLTEGKD